MGLNCSVATISSLINYIRLSHSEAYFISQRTDVGPVLPSTSQGSAHLQHKKTKYIIVSLSSGIEHKFRRNIYKIQVFMKVDLNDLFQVDWY